jgi:hypothetical protein
MPNILEMLGLEELDEDRQYRDTTRWFEEGAKAPFNAFVSLARCLSGVCNMNEQAQARFSAEYGIDLKSPSVEALKKLAGVRWPEDSQYKMHPISVEVLALLTALPADKMAAVCEAPEYSALMTVDQFESVLSRLDETGS